jgi:hypothetical protein
MYTVTKANQNEALLRKLAVLGMEKPSVDVGTFCPLPVLAFFIPPCRSSSMEECKILARTRDKMFPHPQGAFPFPELQFFKGKLYCVYFVFFHTR